MRKAIGLVGAVLLLASVPSVVWAGANPNVKLAMHVVASDDFLYCTELTPATTRDIDPSVTYAEIEGLAFGYSYVMFCAYDFTAMSGVEFAVSGFPTGRGAPPAPGMTYCPDGALVLGDPFAGGGIVSWGLGSCWESANEGPVLPIGWFTTGWDPYLGLLPVTLEYVASTYSDAGNPLNYAQDCSVDFLQDATVREYGGVIGGDVVPQVEVVSPNGGEVLPGGTTQDITWYSYGLSAVDVEYTVNGTDWLPAGRSTTTYNFELNTFSWAVPEENSTTCKVRVKDPDGDPVDESDEFFEIATGAEETITVTAPNNGEALAVGQSYPIAWTSEGIDNVRIWYGTPDGKAWTLIVDSTPAAQGFYMWTVPHDVGQWHMYICDAEDENPCDQTDQEFAIFQLIDITSPVGGEEWMVGSHHDITWTHVGVESLGIVYGEAGNWTTVVSSMPATVGTYDWEIPNDPGTWSVGIYDLADGNPFSISNTFEIYTPSVTVTSPNGGEQWQVGSEQLITWDSRVDGTMITHVSIEYASDVVKQTWQEVIASTENDGEYLWTVPNDNSTNCAVRVCVLDSPLEACDTSDAVFEIYQTLALTAPTGGEEWMVGGEQDITWTSGGIENVDIYYGAYDLKTGAPTPASVEEYLIVADFDASLGTYPWTIPDNPGSWQVRILDSEDGVPLDTGGYFEIFTPTVSVTSPDGGEVWLVGDPYDITWEWRGDFANVSIEYTTDWAPEDKTTWQEVIASTPNDGTYEWTVPNTPSDDCKVRVCALGTTVEACDESEYVFEIQAQEYVEVLTPNGGEEWQVGTWHNVTWTSVEVETLTIWYGDDSKGWTLITWIFNPAVGSYSWLVPNDPGHWYVKICDSDDDPCDTSDSTFEIFVPSVTVTQPNGGEEWVVDDQEMITWTWRGEFPGVSIYYSTGEPGKQVWTPIEGVTPNDGSYEWTIPDTPSTTCLVRVCPEMGIREFEGCDESDDFFTIRAAEYLEVVLPVGGERWLVGTQQTIEWVAVEVENIGIVYGQSGNWKTIETSVPAGKGSYLWTIPDDPGIWRIGIYDASDGNPVGFSNDFEIYDTYTVSGCVDYMHNGIPVPGAGVWLGRPEKTETMTGPDGCYEFTEVEGNEDYMLEPWKDNDVPLFTVMGWDAALCNRVALGLEIPPVGTRSASHAESLSCDLNRDGQITEGDAAAIANKAAGLDWWKSGTIPPEWIFEPPYREIFDLTSDMTEENFSAVLLGDVDGNWVTGLRGAKGAEPASYEAKATVVNNQLEVYIRLRPTFGVVSMDCAFSYDPSILQVSSAVVNYAFMYFTPVVGVHNADGLVYLCAYRPDPSRVQGRVVTVVFDILNTRGDVPFWALELEGFFLNDQPAVGDPLDYTTASITSPGFLDGGIQPNPFNPETSIGFYLPQGEPRPVSLKIYNLQGQLVRTLVDEVMDAGEHTVQWNGTNEFGVEVATGVFFAVLETGDIRQTRKLMLLK